MSGLDSITTILKTYFELKQYSVSKRIENIKGIVKVDSTMYSLKNTTYFILVCRMIPLEVRAKMYMLILNHNDFKRLCLTDLPFIE